MQNKELLSDAVCRLFYRNLCGVVFATILILVMAVMSGVARRAEAEASNPTNVDMGTYAGQFVAIPHATHTRYFVTVPDDGLLLEIAGDTFAQKVISLNGGSSKPWGVAIYENLSDPKVFVTDNTYFRLFIYDLDTEVLESPISMLMSTGPTGQEYSNGIAINTANATDEVFIVDYTNDKVRVINAQTYASLTPISGDGLAAPVDVAVNETTNRVYVITAYNKLFVYDGTNNSYIETVNIFNSPKNIAINEETNKIYITHDAAGQTTVIDGSDDSIEATIFTDSVPYDVAYHPDTDLIYITVPSEGKVYVFDSADNGPAGGASASVTVGASPYGIDYVTPGTGAGGTEPWLLGTVSSSDNELSIIEETDTYAPAFNGITSATDGQSAVEPTIDLTWDAATDLSPPITYLVYMTETQGEYNFAGPIQSVSGTSVQITAGILAPGELEYGDYKWFVVRAQDSAATLNEDDNVVELGTLCSDGAAPTGGEVSAAADTGNGGEIQLTWGAAADNSNFVYNIYVAATSGGQNFSTPAYSAASTTTTLALNAALDADFDFENGQEYFFVVRAEDVSGLENTNTTEKSAIPTDSTPPTFAGIDNALDTGEGAEVYILWLAATDNTPPITYNIYYNQGATIDSYAVPDITTTTQTGRYYITGLTNDVQYAFAVRAEDAEGNEDTNVVVLTATPSDGVNPIFDGIAKCDDAETGTALDLLWYDATDNSTPISYNIYMKTSTTSYNFGSWTYQTQNATYQVTGLTMGVEYYYVVRAEDSAGNEDTNSVELSAIPTDGVDPVFSGLSYATPTASSGEIQLVWDAATDSSPPVLYNIYEAETSGGQNFSSWTYQTTATSTIITGLTNGQEYYYVVRAEDAGTREENNEVEKYATPNDGAAPVFGGISSLVDTGAYGTLLASWSAATDDSSPITYLVFISMTASGQDYNSPDYSTTVTSVSLEGLINGTGYYVSVRARDVAGLTSTNTEELFATPTDTTPPVFAGIASVVDNETGGSLRVYWSSAVDMSSPVTYEIFMATGSASIDYATPIAEVYGTNYYDVDGLTNGVSHKFSIWARDAASPPNYSTNTVQLSGIPTDQSPPSFEGVESVKNVTTTSKEIKVSWSTATDNSLPITYNIYYKKNGTLAEVLADGIKTSTSVTSVTISSLENKQTYYFVVRAEDSAGNEDTNTNIMGGMPVDNVPPDFDGLESAADTMIGNEVLLTWSQPTDDTLPVRYNIYVQKGTTTNLLDEPDYTVSNTASTSLSITGLDNNELYYFAVGAFDAVDFYPQNETTADVIVSATPTDRTPPTFAGAQSVSNTTEGGTLRVSWDEASDRSTPVTYNIYQTTTSGIYDFSSPTYQAPAGSYYDVTGLTDGTTYYYLVTSVDASIYANESSTWTTELSGTPGDTDPPVFGGITGLSIYSGDGELQLQWDEAQDQSTPVQYNIYQAPLSGLYTFSTPTYTTTATIYIATGFEDEQWAFFTVRAQDSVSPPNEDDNVVEIGIQYQDNVAPATPGSVAAAAGDDSTAEGDEYVLISWSTPTLNTDGSALTDLMGYEVFRSTTSGGQNPDPQYAVNRNDGTLDAMIPATWTTYKDYTVATGTEYFYVVVAGDDAAPVNYSPQSTEVSATAVNSDDAIPNPPGDLLALGATGQVNLTWTIPDENTNGTPLTDLAGFLLYRGISSGNYQLLTSQLEPTKTNYQDTNVVDGTTYYYAMKSVDSSNPANESAFSSETYATPGAPTDYPPNAPTNLLTTPGSGVCGLSWTKPTQNTDGSSYADHQGYNVYRYYTGATTTVKINGETLVPSSSYNDYTISTGILYSYSVTAVDEGGNESASSSVTTCIYGTKGVRGRIRVRDMDQRDPATNEYMKVGKENLTVMLVDSDGQTLATAYTDSDGYYQLIYEDGSTSEKYDVRLLVVDGSGYPVSAPMSGGIGYYTLHKDINLQEGSPPFDLLTPEPAPVGAGPVIGNTNCDNIVNALDLAVMKPAWGKLEGDPEYDINVDNNGDGTVNALDIAIMKSFWGSLVASSSTSPCQ